MNNYVDVKPGNDENFKFIGNQYDISADDYYTEDEINQLIAN